MEFYKKGGTFVEGETSTDKKTLKKELKKTDIDSPLLAYDDYLQYVVYNSYKINYKDKDIKKIVQEVVNKALEERKDGCCSLYFFWILEC